MYYKVNTGNTKETNLAALIGKLGHTTVPGEKNQFTICRHHLAEIICLSDLVLFNDSDGFTKKMFEAINHVAYMKAGHETFPESWSAKFAGDTLEEWLELGIIVTISSSII